MSTRGNFHRGGHRRSIAAVCLLVLAAGLIFAAAASQAANPPCAIPGGFEIDGDMLQATCNPAGDDWNTPGINVQSTNQGGTYQTSGKDNGDPSTWTSSGSTPDKTNFDQAYATSRVSGGHFYVYVAWERTDTAGTQGYAIEIDNSGANTASDGTPQPIRSSGGTVFYLSSQGSSAPVFATACKFSSQATYGTSCSNNAANITAAINTSTITDPLAGTQQPAGAFFEVALDITGLTGIAPSCPGPTAASVYLRSITGQTSNGNLKGYMAPLSVAPDSTCVPPPITTTATPGGSLNPIGSTQHDTVTVGTAQAPGVGSVKFYLCSPTDVANNKGDCSAGGALVSTQTLNASGQATGGDVTGATVPNDNALGKYCWRAEFTPNANDHHYLAGSETNSLATGAAGDECFVIVHKSPTVATQIAVTGKNAPSLGFTTLGDTATLSGFAGSVAGQTITFNLYGPYAAGTTPTCTGAAAFTTTGTLDANGSATTSQTFTPTAAGTYVWVASFSGNPLNDPATGKCTDSNESVEVLAPSLSVTKKADAGTVNAGDPIGFKITVANAGPGTANGVTLADPLPGGTTAAGWKIDSSSIPAPGSCTINAVAAGQELDCTAVDLAAGASYDVHISAATDYADCTLYDNTATAKASNSPNKTGHDSIQCQKPDLSVTKKADAGTVNAGDPIGFKITVANAGPGTANGVTLADPLPGGTTAAGWKIDSSSIPAPGSCTINAVAAGQELDCTAVDLAAGASYDVHISAATDAQNCTRYDNTATAGASNSPDKTGSDSITCLKPGLNVIKKADANTVDAGDPIGFTITVGNGGPGTATGVTLKDPLPAGTTASGWTLDNSTIAAPGSCAITGAVGSQELDCTAVDLGVNVSYDVHISAATDFQNCTKYDNTATASSTNSPDATGSDSIQCSTGLVSITKTADHSAPVNAGDQIGFTVEVKNSGAGRVTGVVLNDPLPAGSGSGVTWTIDPTVGTPAQFVLAGAAGAQTLSLASGTLPAGADYKVHITASTSETECSGVYDNTATLTTGNANNPSPVSASEACAYRVDLSVTKAGSPATQDLGSGNITWTIVVTNNGPDTDTGVTIADPMPGGNTFVSATTSQGTCTGGAVLNCSIGTMAAGATVTITLVTTPSAAGPQTNTVTVAGARPETNTANNQATATVQVTAPFVPPPVYCVAVSKVTPNQLFVGRKTMLTIHLTKHGQPVKGIRVRIKGPKLSVTTQRSNAKGVIKQVVKMKKAGIDTFTPLASKRCNTKRVGVTGVFTPPVTG